MDDPSRMRLPLLPAPGPIMMHLVSLLGGARRAIRAGLGIAAFLALLALGSVASGRESLAGLLYAFPIAINASLLVVFGRTLRPGRIPLVTRLEILMNGAPDAELWRYTRRVTVWWTVFFAAMTVECTGLALFAPLHVWSLFANFLNYCAIGAMFLVEYRIRLRVLPNRPHPGFLAFCRRLAAIALRAR